jgi:hypothetical protein
LVKPLDVLLLSLAIGLTLLNAALLGSDYPRGFAETRADPLAPAAPRNSALRAIVIHDLDRPHDGPMPFHFVVGDGGAFPDGQIVVTERWKRQEGDRTIDVALGPAHTPKQEAALLELLAHLRRDCGITDVGTHRELEPKSKCPSGLDSDALRRRLDPR